MEDCSVKDVLGHVIVWEEQALRHPPVTIAGGRPRRYARWAGLGPFNATMMEEKRWLSIAEVRARPDETHAR
jgi:hypothetical protein